MDAIPEMSKDAIIKMLAISFGFFMNISENPYLSTLRLHY